MNGKTLERDTLGTCMAVLQRVQVSQRLLLPAFHGLLQDWLSAEFKAVSIVTYKQPIS